MTDIILHHYDISPYSEKVGIGLGLKRLAWASVELPVIMPKPNLTALTGGYRKTPVLQIGADIYCDSQLIMRELERRYATPSFYPAGHWFWDRLNRRAEFASDSLLEGTGFEPSVPPDRCRRHINPPFRSRLVAGGKWIRTPGPPPAVELS